MASKISGLKVTVKNGVATAKLGFSHPMTTYNQAKAKTGNRDDANFITHITGKIKDETIIDISTSQFFSKNPLFKFHFKCDNFKLGEKPSGRQKREVEEKLTQELGKVPSYSELKDAIKKAFPKEGDYLRITAVDRKGNTYEKSVELTGK
jgi:sulfur-oxidizing protein SoxZ